MHALRNRITLTVLLLSVVTFGRDTFTQEIPEQKYPYASAHPMSEPAIFGEGVVSTGDYDSHPTFAPDGKTLYFVRSTPNFNFWTILVSHFEHGTWSVPEVAPFSGQYSDADPFITRDGSRFYFISKRPLTNDPKKDTDIWVMEKTASGWSEPRNPGASVNSGGYEWYPTLTRDGTLYFGSDRTGGEGKTDLYRARRTVDGFATPENLGGAVNTEFDEYEPFIAPDEKFLIFMAADRTDGFGGGDIFLSYNHNGVWTKSENLGEKINTGGHEYSPMISGEGKYFFWTSCRSFAAQPLPKRLTTTELMKKLGSAGNGLGDIYQIDLSALKLELTK